MSETVVDEKILRDFRTRAKKQYDVEPNFIGVHPHEKAVTGMYEFEIEVRPDRKQRCYFWRFPEEIAGGQFAMDVADFEDSTAELVMNQWLIARKLLARPSAAARAGGAAKKAAKPAAKKAATPKAASKKAAAKKAAE